MPKLGGWNGEGRSPNTGHYADCATYDTLDASDCTCWDRA
jgi:hypothetical protein